jgi:hypothetical protein
VLWNVLAKALLGVLSMVVLGLTTTFSGSCGFDVYGPQSRADREPLSLQPLAWRIPTDTAAMASRAIQWLGNVPTLGRMLGSLFLPSQPGGRICVPWSAAVRDHPSRGCRILGKRLLVTVLGAAWP